MHVDKNKLPSAESERERYEKHQNSIHDFGYISFLNIAIEATLPFLESGMKGLDFGCGPNPVLSQLLEKRGLPCAWYDPFFFPDKPECTFDFIFATECVEHFHNPRAEFLYISSLLNKEGILTIMTSMWDEESSLKDWYYLRDYTHVSIFHPKTIEFIADAFDFNTVYTDQKKVVVLRKR